MKTCMQWALAVPLVLGAALTLSACGDDGGSLPCTDNSECLLVADCCRCQAIHADESQPQCQLTCTVDRCFEEHGQVNVVPRCVDNRCEVATSN